MPAISYRPPHLLSDSGSTRATAYCFSNKAVTLGASTHVVWLDAVAMVCARTYDRDTDTWSPTFRLFDGCDNHSSPALTADREGRLHLLYGPHGYAGNWNQARFKHRVSAAPNRVDQWEEETDVGYGATYPSITHTPEGLDAIAYRGGERPWALMFQRQMPSGRWTHAQTLLCEDLDPQYTHLGAWIHAHPSGDTTLLYVGAHLYAAERNNSLGVVLFRSNDLGQTWTDASGRIIDLPASYDEGLAIPHPPGARFCGVATGPDATEWVLAATYGIDDPSMLLSRWDGVTWQTTDVSGSLPEGYRSDYHSLSVDAEGGIHIVCSALPASACSDTDRLWGHPAHEVFHLCSFDGGQSFSCAMVSEPDPRTANWLPAISHNGVYHPMRSPVILYTHGVPGEGCSPQTPTEAYCVLTE